MGKRWAVAVVAGTALLAGCSSSEGDARQAFCAGFGNGATFQWTSCTNCTVLNPGNVSDGDLATESSIVPSGGTSEMFVLTATSVNPIAGGAVLGAWVTQPSTITAFDTDFETFLNGNSQEVLDTSATGNGVVVQSAGGTPAGGFIGMRTTLAFDEVRFTRQNGWALGADPVYRVYEMCSDGGAE
ncbi:MAG: hypothetical protein ACHQRO_09560 [Vicinamibacteria bacterium]